MGGDTQNWIRFYNCRKEVQYREDFINSYYCAMVLVNLQKDPIQIPESVFIEELIEDEKYTMDQITKSKIIQQFIIRLLQKTDTQKKITERNYESELKNFFDQKRNCGSSPVNPLQNESSFHSLSTKAKLWIFVQLLGNTGPFDDPTEIAEDSHGNVYKIVDGGRLYVGYGKELGMVIRDDSERRTSHRSPFEQYLAKYEQGKLLAETEKQWKQIIAVYDSYDEVEVARKLRENIERAKERMVLTIEQKEHIREEFNAKMQPKKQTLSQENNNEEGPPSYQDVVVGPKKAICWNWPDCSYGNRCFKHHPTLDCTNFQKSSKCPGFNCRFIHPVCPNDGHCTSLDCAFKHDKSEPTLRRRSKAGMRGQNNPQEERSRETTRNLQGDQRRSPSRGPRGILRNRSQSRGRDATRASSPTPPPPPPTNPPPPRQEQRPSSRNDMRDNYERSRAQSRGPAGNDRYRHQSRGSQASRHTANSPPRQEQRPSARNYGRDEQERSRAQSRVNNRHRHQSRGSCVSLDTTSPEARNRFDQNGMMRGQENVRPKRCAYWPDCKKPDDVCQWAHPKNPCRDFPKGKCSLGRLCPNLHGKCGDDGTCRDIMQCPYDHYEQRVPLAPRRY